jgi:hypothetical protein
VKWLPVIVCAILVLIAKSHQPQTPAVLFLTWALELAFGLALAWAIWPRRT